MEMMEDDIREGEVDDWSDSGSDEDYESEVHAEIEEQKSIELPTPSVPVAPPVQ